MPAEIDYQTVLLVLVVCLTALGLVYLLRSRKWLLLKGWGFHFEASDDPPKDGD